MLGLALGLAYLYGVPRSDEKARRSGFSSEQPDPSLRVGAVAPDFELRDLNDDPVRLEDQRGGAVLINFWATWCGPCRLEMPILQDYYERYNLQVLAVNFDEPAPVVRDFRDELGMTFPVLLDPGGEVQQLYNVRGYPTTYIIDSEGIIQTVHIGVLTAGQVQEYLDEVGIGS